MGNKKKVLIRLLALLLAAALLTGCGGTHEQTAVSPTLPSVVPETTLPAETVPVVDRFPSVPEEWKDHFLIQSRRLGFCDVLSGTVGITVIFADDGESGWLPEEQAAYTDRMYEGARELCYAASLWDVDLQISIHTHHCTVSGRVDSATADTYVETILDAAGLPTRDMNLSLADALDVDEAPVIFVFNKPGRAYAQQGNGAEYCVLFSDPQPFSHELTHLFGAEDYYYHPELKRYAAAFFPESIMLDSGVIKVDDLTAYLIGWTDELTQDAYGFLHVTDSITQDSLNAAGDANIFTGYGTRVFENGVYEGDLILGAPNGVGTMCYQDGSIYQGEWVEGICHGFGSFSWTNGDYYEGQWLDGARTGYGYYRWADGTVYVGEFVDGNRTGQGTVTYPNGTKQTGEWENNNFIG